MTSAVAPDTNLLTTTAVKTLMSVLLGPITVWRVLFVPTLLAPSAVIQKIPAESVTYRMLSAAALISMSVWPTQARVFRPRLVSTQWAPIPVVGTRSPVDEAIISIRMALAVRTWMSVVEQSLVWGMVVSTYWAPTAVSASPASYSTASPSSVKI